MKKLIYIILIAIFTVGCNQANQPDYVDANSFIYLSASAENSTTSRAPYEYTTPNESTDGVLQAAVWASTNSLQYLNKGWNGKNNGTNVAIHAGASFENGEPQLLSEAVYPQQGNPVYFVGFHPQTGWTTPSGDEEGKSASYTFNGSQDVMFAKRIEGTYADPNAGTTTLNVRPLVFMHLLTWLKLKIKAENQNALDAWGKIRDIKIISKNQVTVDLNKETFVHFDTLETTSVHFSNETQLPFYVTESDNVFPTSDGYSMKFDSEEVAYVLCSPVVAKVPYYEAGVLKFPHEYQLYIKTDYREVTLEIDLIKKNATSTAEAVYFEGSTRSRSFTLNLVFKMGNTIMVSADVVDWELGGSGTGDLGE